MPVTETGCWIWLGGADELGYGRYGNRKHRVNVPRRAYELYVGPIAAGLVVRHTCDMPSCVNPAHLVTGTYKDNSQDMVRRGRSCAGDKHWTKRRTTL